jgi:hypothetical protein
MTIGVMMIKISVFTRDLGFRRCGPFRWREAGSLDERFALGARVKTIGHCVGQRLMSS